MNRKDSMKAIITRYLGPTNHRPGRIVASDGEGNRIILPYDHDANHGDRHGMVARALCNKMGWDGELIEGIHGSLHCFVFRS
jgi:hypothetical protein